MDNYEYGELIKTLENKLSNIKSILKPVEIQQRLKAIEALESEINFWSNVKRVQEVGKEKKKLQRRLDKYEKTENLLTEAKELFELSQGDEEGLGLLFDDAQNLENTVAGLEVEVMLSGELDANNAILTITPGAGGTESQDWALMLYRMYMRFAERMGFKAEILDYQVGEEAGIKDAAILIKSENAYGYLKAENGVHRLVRISPFDSNDKRHTSFTSVNVSAEIDDDIDIDIEDKDIRVDTYRASGAGGQHVNKTESAIRITHLVNNIVVQCQNNRSQHKNKDTAMKMLKSRLYELEIQKREMAKNNQEKSDIGWGHQIRSYVLHPYQQVKDTRSGKTYSNVNAILDGDLQKIIEDVLVGQ